MTLCEIVEKHGLPVKVVSSNPTFGGIFFTLEHEDRDGKGFWFSHPDGNGWMSQSELTDSWVTEAELALPEK
jgi:hypothetical protein